MFTNNDYMAFLAKNGKFLDQTIEEKFQKYDFHYNQYFKMSFLLKIVC